MSILIYWTGVFVLFAIEVIVFIGVIYAIRLSSGEFRFNLIKMNSYFKFFRALKNMG